MPCNPCNLAWQVLRVIVMVHSGDFTFFFFIIPSYVCLKCFLTSVISVPGIIEGKCLALQ